MSNLTISEMRLFAKTRHLEDYQNKSRQQLEETFAASFINTQKPKKSVPTTTSKNPASTRKSKSVRTPKTHAPAPTSKSEFYKK